MFKEYLRKGDHAYKIFETKPIHIPLISFQTTPLSVSDSQSIFQP